MLYFRTSCVNSYLNTDLVHTLSKSALPKTSAAGQSRADHEILLGSQSSAASKPGIALGDWILLVYFCWEILSCLDALLGKRSAVYLHDEELDVGV